MAIEYKIGYINEKLGENINFTAEVLFYRDGTICVESINSYKIAGSGDMYDTLYGVKFIINESQSDGSVYNYEIDAFKVTSKIENDVILPSTITSISSYFFGGRSIVGLGVNKINYNAFRVPDITDTTNIKDSEYTPDYTECSYVNVAMRGFVSKLISVNVSENCYIGIRAFGGCKELVSMSIMNGTIRTGAFIGCKNLTTLKFGESVIFNYDKTIKTNFPFYLWTPASLEDLVLTTIIGKYNQVLNNDWIASGRSISEKTKNYKLVFQNHYNAFVGIDIESYSDGQVSIAIDDENKTARLTEDTRNRYTGLCVVADGKIYQFMDKIALE